MSSATARQQRPCLCMVLHCGYGGAHGTCPYQTARFLLKSLILSPSTASSLPSVTISPGQCSPAGLQASVQYTRRPPGGPLVRHSHLPLPRERPLTSLAEVPRTSSAALPAERFMAGQQLSLTAKLQVALAQAQRGARSQISSSASPSPTPSPTSSDRSWRTAVTPNPTLAYLSDLLADEGLASNFMVTDLLAYQVIHNELADMIGGVASRLDLATTAMPTAPVQSSEVEEWISSLLSPPRGMEESAAATAAAASSAPRLSLASAEEVMELLLECGEAVAGDELEAATGLIGRIRQQATPHGTHLQRLAHYFMEALMAKLAGTGADLFTAIKRDKPSVLDTTRAFKFYWSTDPTLAMAHHFCNDVLMETFQGADRVHIVDYGIQNGHQWPGLMQLLVDRPGGPPHLRITGIEFPQPGLNSDGMVKLAGRRLARFAAKLGLPFEFKAFSCKWEDVQIADLGLREEEVLAVSCVFRLRHLLDDSVVLANPRRTVLERICDMSPRVFITAVVSLAANAPFMMTRLQEAIPYLECYFSAFDCTTARDSADRLIIERELLGREILNLIACEGMDRRERPEAYQQWHWRLLKAGFDQLPVTASRFSGTKEILRDYHTDWTIGQNQGWILSGWRGRIQHGYAAWTPAR